MGNAATFLALYIASARVLATVNWCQSDTLATHPDMANRIVRKLPYGKTTCYFEVRDIRVDSISYSATSQEFSIERARSVCKEFSATLPSVTSVAENQFLAQLGGYVVLGMKVCDATKTTLARPNSTVFARRRTCRRSRPVKCVQAVARSQQS